MKIGRETRTTRVLSALGIKHVMKGRRAWARCPYHADRDPSWFVDVKLGGHFCFSCKAGGTLAELVTHVRGMRMRDAIEFVKTCGEGFSPPTARTRVVARPASIGVRRFRLPREVYVGEALSAWPTPIRLYAVSRSIGVDQVERFGLGYAVEGRLGSRIVIPVRDLGSRPVGYSARDITGENERRYLTPHESEGADLDGLFGEHLWPHDNRRTSVVIVTEGALNALAVDRALPGVYVAAIGGSDARPGHVSKLALFGKVVLLTDPDPAGDRVAAHLASMLGRHAEVVRVRLPAGEDADILKPDVLRRFLDRYVGVLPRGVSA